MTSPGPPLEPYADADRERYRDEAPKATPGARTPFERDRARVLHSAALRRLAAKTQVVGVETDDVPRTRLTHSLECAQIGRELAAALGANPDLVDAACLAHDLGHPPFGHNGETALASVAEPCGGFEGNAQSFRELTRLEPKVAGAGLNLARATLDAATKYPWPRRDGQAKFGVYDDDLPTFTWMREAAPGARRCLEAQAMDWADDVAYSVHDLEDGIMAGLIDLASLDDPGQCDEVVEQAVVLYGPCERNELMAAAGRLRRESWWVRGPAHVSLAGLTAVKAMTSELIARFSAAAVRATREQFGDGPLTRYRADLVVPADVRAECTLLKAVAARYVMARPGVVSAQARQREMLAELVDVLNRQAPHTLDPALAERWTAAVDDAARLRVVVDQVAQLTDLQAARWHARLCT